MPPRTRGRLPLTDKTLTINIPKPKRAMARRQAEQPKSNICILIPPPPARKPTPTTAAEIAAAFRATAKPPSTAGEEKEKQADEGTAEGKLGAEAMRRPGLSKTKAPSLKANSSFSIVIPKLQSSACTSQSLKRTPTGQSSVESGPSGFRAASNASSTPASKPQSPEPPVHEEALLDNEIESNYNSESLEYLRVDSSSSSGSESPPRAAGSSLGDPFDELPAPPSANLPERFSNEDYEIPLPPSSQPRRRISPFPREEERYSDASEDDPFGFGSADRRVKAMKAGGVFRKPVVPAGVQLPTPQKPAEDEGEDEDEEDKDEDDEEEAGMEEDNELPEVVFQKPKPTRKTRLRKRKSYNEESEDDQNSNSSDKEAPARRGRKAKGKAKAKAKASKKSSDKEQDIRTTADLVALLPRRRTKPVTLGYKKKRSSWVLESDDDEEEDKTDYDENVPTPASRVIKKSKSSRSAVTEKGNKKQIHSKTTSGPSKASKASAKPASRLKAPKPPSSTDEDVREARIKRIKLYKELDGDEFEEELVL